MKCLSRFVKLRCPVLLWMYFLLLQLCAVQTVATSLYYMHLTKKTFVIYIFIFSSLAQYYSETVCSVEFGCVFAKN